MTAWLCRRWRWACRRFDEPTPTYGETMDLLRAHRDAALRETLRLRTDRFTGNLAADLARGAYRSPERRSEGGDD
jgi:hypothetical protein